MIVDEYAQTIWDYMLLHHSLEKADVILVLGSYDVRSAEHGATLFLQGLAPVILFSGDTGQSGRTRAEFGTSEAEKFAEIAKDMGVPAKAILIENKSRNTGENMLFSKNLLEKEGIFPEKVIVVQKPYAERRIYATFVKQWPDVKCIVSSPSITYEEYPNERISKEKMISTMIGDLERIKEYPARGFQVEQTIPDDVWFAYGELVRLGFNKRPVVN